MIALFSSLAVSLALAAAPPATPAAAAPAVSAPDCQSAVATPDGQQPLFLDSFCQADCTEGPDVSCSGATCSAVNQNCSFGQRGYVVCDGNRIDCPVCPGGGGGCTFMQCRQGCNCPGGVTVCISVETCECECIYQ